MSDTLVKRLRDDAEGSYICGEWNADPDDLRQAADRIEQLEATLKSLENLTAKDAAKVVAALASKLDA